MEIILNDYHKKVNAEMRTKVEYWKTPVDGNVLVDDDGHLYFIDTIIFKSNTGGLDTYNSLSPRASKSK